MLSDELMAELLTVLVDPATDRPRVGRALFSEAEFSGHVWFDRTVFTGKAAFDKAIFRDGGWFTKALFEGVTSFEGATLNESSRFHGAEFSKGLLFRGATFVGGADFDDVKFRGYVDFGDAIFGGGVTFHESRFGGSASFRGVRIEGNAGFKGTRFEGLVRFHEVKFDGRTSFKGARFDQEAWFALSEFTNITYFDDVAFNGAVEFGSAKFAQRVSFIKAQFGKAVSTGPMQCNDSLDFTDALFSRPAEIEATAQKATFFRTRFEEPAYLRFRCAVVSLENALLLHPCAVSTDYPRGPQRAEYADRRMELTASISSISGVDASMLLFSDVDLSRCRFAGAHHLDQIRLEGTWHLSRTPPGTYWRWGVPRRWTTRLVIHEERLWRSLSTRRPLARQGWGDHPSDFTTVPGLATLTTTYRQLRKAREDAKDEPGAADFYYGEMEMRRHSRSWKTAERWLLQVYWLLSGYGLRASRALGWLALAMMTTVILMMGIGLPQDSPKQEATGTVRPGGGKVTFEINKGDPQNPTGDHFTGERFDKALSITLNSVVFRSSGQDLTTSGGYIEMASRLSEPVLLGLAALAIRGRVKR
ncbi:pentapeptide repeat-containing protein [Streptomyces sp. NPDC091290]|uniref:pentapeptide repeat-containing protein n=1 Tax=Streptomyces sp. NPDC091290 TaxID=3365990 RepID=UPI00381DE467